MQWNLAAKILSLSRRGCIATWKLTAAKRQTWQRRRLSEASHESACLQRGVRMVLNKDYRPSNRPPTGPRGELRRGTASSENTRERGRAHGGVAWCVVDRCGFMMGGTRQVL